MALAQIHIPKLHLGKWKQRLKPAVCPSCYILSHSRVDQESTPRVAATRANAVRGEPVERYGSSSEWMGPVTALAGLKASTCLWCILLGCWDFKLFANLWVFH